jgi:hypothetical protein
LEHRTIRLSPAFEVHRFEAFSPEQLPRAPPDHALSLASVQGLETALFRPASNVW